MRWARVVVALALAGTVSACGIDRSGLAESARDGATGDAPAGRDAGSPDTGPLAGRDGGPVMDDATLGDGGPADDAPTELDAGARCRTWELDFDVDPTTVDADGDSIVDWATRPGTPFPTAELSGGVWHAATHVPLDTRPLDDFRGVTRIDVRMRSTQMAGAQGATFWINADFDGPSYTPAFVQVRLEGGDQRAILFRNATSTREQLAEATALGTDFVHLEMTLDAPGGRITASVDGVDLGTHDLVRVSPPTPNRFATVVDWSANAEFDHVWIETCDP